MDACMERLPPAAAGPEWTGLPAGVLQLIFSLATTWTVPGSCLAAPVCRSWRSAATGCTGIRLLYHAGDSNRDASFKAWLGKGSRQLGSLILTSDRGYVITRCLEPLVQAAAAAVAAGRPLPLQTLRVVGGVRVSTHLTGQLLAGLPKLRCLQLGMDVRNDKGCASSTPQEELTALMLNNLAPLKQATQLQELYLGESPVGEGMAQLLPPSLLRLSGRVVRESLSHLTQLAFMRAVVREPMEPLLSSSNMPDSLQELDVDGRLPRWSVLKRHESILSRCYLNLLPRRSHWGPIDQVTRLPKLQAATVSGGLLTDETLLMQEQLSSLQLNYLQGAEAYRRLSLAANLHNLQHLHLEVCDMPAAVDVPLPDLLAALTGLTRLAIDWTGPASAAQQRAWSGGISLLPRLRWLSVPAWLAAEGAWLGCLQQLQVLVLQCDCMQGLERFLKAWLLACRPEALPPRLQLFGLAHGLASYRAEGRSLQRQLSSTGCHVVVVGDLKAVFNPTQQLAGLPAALQQALQ